MEHDEDSGARFRTERSKSGWRDDDEQTTTEILGADNGGDVDDDGEDDDEDGEQMQLDTGVDFYDEDEYADDESGDGAVYSYGDLVAKDTKDHSDKVLDLTLDTTTKRNNERRHITAKQNDEEIDMGYDEDDERIAAERPKTVLNVEKGYMNEEGSGANIGSGIASRFKDGNRFKPNYMTFGNDNSNNKGRNMYKERGGGSYGQEVGIREGSGNFANDDDDENDDDDDDGVEGDDRENESGKDNSFFASKHKNSYFRKNTNDAIKIISTPLGKVGIVYQQTHGEDDTTASKSGKSESADKTKSTSTALTDFDALSPDPDSSRLASHPKITPVLTADGKVALLYRGDSENSKYEPIRNLTHKIATNNKDDTTDNNDSYAIATTNKKKQQKAIFANSDSDSDEQTDLNESSDFELSDTKLLDETKNDYAKSVFVPPTSGSFIMRSTDSVLPMINRPLSEVLGIKKNQFKQFRVKDTMSPSSTDAITHGASPLAEQSAASSSSSSSTTLHFLTKVNLAEYPTSLKSGPNRDFDFSQDNTMLDERNRHRVELTSNHKANEAGGKTDDSSLGGQQQQHWSPIDSDDNAGFANEEMLSKTEVVDLAIIPQLDNDEGFGRFNRHEVEARRHHRNRQTHRHRQKQDDDLSGIHCVMQVFMGIAAISTVFGMLGTFFKQRILDQLRTMHW